MTLQQLKYAIEVTEKNSINGAAKELYISQPSFSSGSYGARQEEFVL